MGSDVVGVVAAKAVILKWPEQTFPVGWQPGRHRSVATNGICCFFLQEIVDVIFYEIARLAQAGDVFSAFRGLNLVSLEIDDVVLGDVVAECVEYFGRYHLRTGGHLEIA